MNELAVARVIINTQAKSLDREFHYQIPEGMQLTEGVRVEVPFGNGNKKMVGFYVGRAPSSEYQLKPILKVLDETPYLSANGIALARYVRNTYLCSMAEAMRLLLPPAFDLKIEYKVRFLQEKTKPTPVQKLILDTLKAGGGSVEMGKLKQACRLKSTVSIKKLAQEGIVAIEEYTTGAQTEKILRYALLAVSEEEALEAMEQLNKSAVAAKRALEMLVEHQTLLLSDLQQSAKCSLSSIYLLQRERLIHIEEREVYRSPLLQKPQICSDKKILTQEQKAALDFLTDAIEKKRYETALLHGVTGSGKTEVFLQSVQTCVAMGRNAIILVPEIALTPQMTERFYQRFGQGVAVLHSGLSLGERYDEWRRIHRGEVHVVVGARSAVFAPFENIGLIVVDEEHESTYKSETSPKYHAVEVADYRARQNSAVLLLASATPSVESYYRAMQGEYRLLELKKRVNNRPLPQVEIVDMAKELAEGNKSVFSRRLLYELNENIKRKEQSILFLNRRGYSTFVSCRSCGYVVKCPHCSVSLTYHQNGDYLTCHYCGYRRKNVYLCPECGSSYIRYFGTGTQKVEDELKRIFPEVELLRMDADTTSHKFSHERIFRKFRDERIPILLGTQMVTKGLDFPNVTLVGVLAADSLLNMDDFRASERAFSMLSQVCGRAGRGSLPGRALIQTYQPANATVRLAARHDYFRFYQNEIAARRLFDNPPFTKIVHIIISGERQQQTGEYAQVIAQQLKQGIGESGVCKAFFGPAEAPLKKLKSRYRFRILLKCEITDKMHRLLEDIYNCHIERNTKFSLSVNINSNNIL